MQIHEAMTREENMTRAFEQQQALIFEGGNFFVPEHLTMVGDCDEETQLALTAYVDELKRVDTASCLSFTPTENFHMTVQYPVQEDTLDLSREVVDRTLTQSPIELDIHGVHIRPQGISLACYSPDGELSRLRSELAEATGASFDPASRLANIGWITIARFVQTPSNEIVQNVVDHVDTSFGALKLAGNVHVYRSQHRERIGAEKVW